MSAAALLSLALPAGAHAVGGLDPPTNVSPPVVTGTPQAGQVLTCVPGAWNGTAPITYTYEWSRNGSSFGSGASTYTVAGSDEGASITCTERATNLFGSAAATSAPVSVPAPGTPQAPAPGLPGTTPKTPGAPAAGDTTAPVIVRFKTTPSRAPLYVVKRRGTRRVRVYRRQRFHLTLSEAATVVIAVKHRNRAPKHPSEPGGSMAVKLGRGTHRVRSAHTIGYFRTGRYKITAQATDAAGNRSATVTTTLRVTKPHR